MKYKTKEIFCPSCNQRVATYDGRSTMNVIVKCRNCNKRVVYHIDTWETEIKDIPKRNCSSGMTFI